MSLIFACTVHAQKDVTTFLGIPVDGTKSEMRKKLIAKGFTPTKQVGADFLDGEFNGVDVHLYIETNNNKVYRIMLADANTRDEANIKIRFNTLVSQFNNNKRYICLDDFELSESEDISYGMNVENQIYQAAFCQAPELILKGDTLAFQKKLRKEALKEFTAEQLQNPTEAVQEAIDKIITVYGLNLLSKKIVWFQICSLYGKYYITMYYDNEYNHANGEDL